MSSSQHCHPTSRFFLKFHFQTKIIKFLFRSRDISLTPPQAVFEGDTGLLAGLGGKVWVDHSTTDYEQVPLFYKFLTDLEK